MSFLYSMVSFIGTLAPILEEEAAKEEAVVAAMGASIWIVVMILAVILVAWSQRLKKRVMTMF